MCDVSYELGVFFACAKGNTHELAQSTWNTCCHLFLPLYQDQKSTCQRKIESTVFIVVHLDPRFGMAPFPVSETTIEVFFCS